MSSAWSQLDQLLTCAICLDRYKNPKLLPCHHTYCMEPCLEGLVDYARRQIKCPECRAEHRIPYQGVQTFPTNVTLVRFLDLHRAVTGEEPESQEPMERCGVCSEKNYLERCNHCEKKICQECKEAHLDILRREIGRITGQIRRGLNRLSDTLTSTQKNNEKLERCRDQVSEEIEDLVKRYVKAIHDAEERLKHELDLYVLGEGANLSKLREDLDTEVNNITSNCDMIEKHIVEDTSEWTDSELVEYKDICLKTLDFMRNFDPDASDFARRVKFQANADPEVLHKTLIGFGEIKLPPAPTNISTPNSLPSVPSMTNLAPPPSNVLTRSQSDHRLAAQFQRKQDRSFLDTDRVRTSYGGHASDSESRGDSYFGRGKRDDYRKNLDRPSYLDESRDITSSTTRGSRFLRPSDDYPTPSRWSRPSDHSEEPHTFRSRFARELVSDDDPDTNYHHSHRSVRFEEPSSTGSSITNSSTPPPPPVRVMDTEDATRGPLSGVIRLMDSAYVLGRLHQNEVRAKTQEHAKEAEPPPAPTPAPAPIPPARRPASRQISDDTVDKEKKQAQASAGATTPPPASTPLPTPVAPSSPLPTTPERPVTKRLASLQKDTEERASPISQRSDSSESGSSRGSPFEDAPSSPPPHSAETKHRWRRTSTDSAALEADAIPKSRPDSPRQSTQTSRSPRPPMGKAVSLDQSTPDGGSRRTVSIEKKAPPPPPVHQSSFHSRYQQPVVQAPIVQRRVESDDESESGDSSDSDSDDKPGGKNAPTASTAVNTLLARSAQARREVAETKRESLVNAPPRFSNYAREKEREDDPSKSRSTSASRKSSVQPLTSRNTDDTRSRFRRDEAEDESPYNRYLSRSRSSAVVSTPRHDPSPPTTESDRLARARRSRLSRSRSTHEMGQGDDSGEDDPPITSYRARYGSSSSSPSTGELSRSRSHHALKSREQSPVEESTPSAATSSWAQYLRQKYGTGRSSSTTTPPTAGSKSVSRSRSSHSLYSRSNSDNSSEDEAGKDGRRDSVFSRYGEYSFTFPRSMYMQKKRMALRIGCRGTEPGCFTWPRGVAVGLDNNVVVADSSNHRVQVFDLNGKFLQEFGRYGSGEGEFDCLAGVAVNRIGQYIVSDRYNHRIQVFDPSGRFLRAFGCEGRTDGRFSYPWGITTDSLGFIYVCDKENHRIQVFQSDGTFVGKFGSIGSRGGFLEHPHYIAVSNTNRVVVSDSNNHRVQIFDVNGRSLSTFGTEGSDEGQFKFPRGVAVDDQGYIIVGDSGNNRIQIFHPDGTFLRSFGTWGAGDGEFKGLEGIAVTSSGSILVCDRENHRIQVF